MKYAAIIYGLALVAAPLRAQGRLDPEAQALSFHDDFELGNVSDWQVPHPEDWAILTEGENHYLHMIRPREPGVPRRPVQFALLKGVRVGSFDFSTRLRREGRSMIVVFNYVDPLHFYYVHLSMDRGATQPVHNGIFLVDGAPRVRVAGKDAVPALPDKQWHTVRILRDVRTGSINIFMDEQDRPLFSVVDHTFACGQIGIGSFDETGDFDDVQLESNDAACPPQDMSRPRKGGRSR